MSDGAPLFGSLFASVPDDWDVIPFADAVDFREGPGILARISASPGFPCCGCATFSGPLLISTAAIFSTERWLTPDGRISE
jgi:hypothetical protein